MEQAIIELMITNRKGSDMSKVKRIAAMIGLIFIVSMYLVSFLSALFATEYSYGLFMASIFSTIVVPIMIYLFIMVYKMVHKKDETEGE
jgi:large-conductance mechanosensitive channel